MKCDKCGCDVFCMDAPFKTEWPDAKVVIKTIVAKSVLEVERKLTGSFYLDSDRIVAKCYRCGKKTAKIDIDVRRKLVELFNRS